MALLIAAAAIVVISVVCVFLADPIIRLCGSDADTHQEAVAYFQIIMGGIVFQVLSWIINAAHQVGMNILSLSFAFGDGQQEMLYIRQLLLL